MDFIIIILAVLILFFIMRTNYKLSEHEEKTRRVLNEDIKNFSSVNEELLQRITSIENKISFYQNQLNDLMSENNSQNTQRNRRIAKELEQIKNDTDIIKSLHLKRSIKKSDEKIQKTFFEPQEPEREIRSRPQIARVNSESANDEVKEEKHEKEVLQTVPVEKKSEGKPVSSEDGIFKKNIDEKIGNLTIDDIVLLKQVFGKPNGIWFNSAEIEEDQANNQFVLPKLSRKLIVDGVPVIQIKTLRDKMMIMWGESLTDSKVEIVLNAIRGEM